MIENKQGLSADQVEKIQRPYAHNSEPAVNFKAVTETLNRADDDTAWSAVSLMLAKAQD